MVYVGKIITCLFVDCLLSVLAVRLHLNAPRLSSACKAYNRVTTEILTDRNRPSDSDIPLSHSQSFTPSAFKISVCCIIAFRISIASRPIRILVPKGSVHQRIFMTKCFFIFHFDLLPSWLHWVLAVFCWKYQILWTYTSISCDTMHCNRTHYNTI